jgi:hypothetical protein
MSVKCAIFEFDYQNPAPSYKDLDVNLGKTGKVLYGGGKRKSKTVPYLDKLHIVSNAFDRFSKLLFPQLDDSYHYFELYLFDKDANETMLYLKHPNQIITHFIIDDVLIDTMHHLGWSYDHLCRYVRELESTANSLNFFNEKEIADTKYQKSFPAFVKATDKLIDETIKASERVTENAELIFKSGW